MFRIVFRFCLLFLVLLPIKVFAQGVISDGSVSLTVDGFASNHVLVSTSGIGAGDQVHSIGFWYRTGQDTQEYPVVGSQSPSPDGETYSGNLATLTYNDVGGRGLLSAVVNIILQEKMGDGPGIIYQLAMTPLDGALTVEVFFYANPDMDGNSANDSGFFYDMGDGEWGLVVGDQTCMEMFSLSRVSRDPFDFPDGYQVMQYPGLLEALSDTSLTNLDDSGLPFRAGDISAAFQFNGYGTLNRRWMSVMAFYPEGAGDQPSCRPPAVEYIPVPGPGRIALAMLAMLMLGGAWHFRSRFI